ncbi:MAG: hypothetical protein Q9201_005278 [Fulgogasparrea decipioides]
MPPTTLETMMEKTVNSLFKALITLLLAIKPCVLMVPAIPRTFWKPTRNQLRTPIRRIANLISSVRLVIQDFVRPNRRSTKAQNSAANILKRSGSYYNPFKKPSFVVVRSQQAIQELCEAPQLSQRAVYSDIFGLQQTISHAQVGFDPNEQSGPRLRLATRAIKARGLAQLESLYPYLQAKLKRVVISELEPKIITSGD